jgi:uncharacterized membrane protein
MQNLIQVFLLSMTPVGELRLSIPFGIAVWQINWVLVFFVSIVGNIIPAILILLFFKKFSSVFSKKSAIFRKFCEQWENRTKGRHSKKVEKYGIIGLALIVSIPLPLTGAYTGSLLAVLMNLPFKKSLVAIFSGVIFAGIMVTTMVFLGINIQNYLGWQAFLGLILFSTLILWYFKKRNNNSSLKNLNEQQ